jgi:predicted nuclease with TOPRIM domain
MSIEMRNRVKVLEAEKSRLVEQQSALAAEISELKRRLTEIEGLLADIDMTSIQPQRRGRPPKNAE